LKLQQKHLFFFIILLIFPALFIHLGRVAFINDEAIRALVALEMDLSGNYIAPTLFGEFYYNKPPLYNWILLVFSKIYGSTNEFIARLPTVVFLLAYATTIFYFSIFPKNISLPNSLLSMPLSLLLAVESYFMTPF